MGIMGESVEWQKGTALELEEKMEEKGGDCWKMMRLLMAMTKE